MKNEFGSIFRSEMQEFIAYTVSCGMAHKTKANALLQFDKYLIKTGLDEKKLDRYIFYDYIRSKENIRPRTVEAYTNTVRSFAKYLIEIKNMRVSLSLTTTIQMQEKAVSSPMFSLMMKSVKLWSVPINSNRIIQRIQTGIYCFRVSLPCFTVQA